LLSLQLVVRGAVTEQHESHPTPNCDILKAPVNKLTIVSQMLHHRENQQGRGGREEEEED